jgi:hypothetical protein
MRGISTSKVSTSGFVCLISSRATRAHRDSLGRQVLENELGVTRTDVCRGHVAKHIAAAEHLRFQRAASCTHLHQLVDQ